MIKTTSIFLVLFSVASVLKADFQKASNCLYADRPFVVRNPIDKLLLEDWRKNGLKSPGICSDEVFIRRIFLDLTGTLPKVSEVERFINNRHPQKRQRLIKSLLKRDAFVDYWTMKWCDTLRVKSEFPINLWPNAVQAYNRWIEEAVRKDMGYDRFAYELLVSSGSNFRDPQVNFYRANQDHTPAGLASVAALTFMGCRFDKMAKSHREALEKLFSRVAYKKTAEWKEEIVYVNPEPVLDMKVKMPDGVWVKVPDDKDPREVFAKWLIRPGNRWFARAAVNRIWFWFFGRGLVHEPDDIRKDNPPVNNKLLDYLSREFIRSGYSFKKICYLITSSSAYQQSSVCKGDYQNAVKHFAVYQVRRLDAEVIVDMIRYLTGYNEKYMSVIPEPFTYIPKKNKTIALADGSITSSLLSSFGRSSRDSGMLSERNNKISSSQRLFLLNSTSLQNLFFRSYRIRSALKRAKGNREKCIQNIYLMILSRYPTKEEMKIINSEHSVKSWKNKWPKRRLLEDVVWALVNSKEFIYRH